MVSLDNFFHIIFATGDFFHPDNSYILTKLRGKQNNKLPL